MWLAQELVNTTRIPAVIHEILIVQCLVTPRHVDAVVTLNDKGILMLKQACSEQYSVTAAEGSNTHRIEALHSSIAPEINGLGRYCAKFGVKVGNIWLQF